MPARYKKHTAAPEETVSVLQFVFEIAGTVLAGFVVLLLVMTFFVRQVTVDGSSMADTLHDDERLLVSCCDYHPACGDIVIVTHGSDLDEAIVKRVIAVGGQTLDIDFSTGEVIVDGVLLKENYIRGTTRALSTGIQFPMTIPQGYVFVMGDNREHSLDSRSEKVGLIPEENIIGKAIFRWYPIDKIGSL